MALDLLKYLEQSNACWKIYEIRTVHLILLCTSYSRLW